MPDVIVVNGRQRALAGNRLEDLVLDMGFEPRQAGLAVAVNGEIVLRSHWNGFVLKNGDTVELVAATQGG